MIYKGEDLWNKDGPYLEHKNGFKYILKLPVGKTFRYFYDQASIRAYRAAKQINNTAQSVSRHIFKTRSSSNTRRASEYEQKVKRNPNLEHKSGTDPKGYKYVARLRVGNKFRYFYSDEEYQAYVKRQDYQNNEPEFMKEYRKSDSPYTAEEDAVCVNPKYSTIDKDYCTNCQECTFIYEMRRRGYDVEYNTKYNYSGHDGGKIAETYNSGNAVKNCFEGATLDYFTKKGLSNESKVKDAKQLSNPSGKEFKAAMKKNYPPNSRGNLIVAWKGGGAHSMAWETDSKGNVTIRDTQLSGKGRSTTYDPDRLFRKTRMVATSRLDNLKPKPAMKKIIQNRRKSNFTETNKQEQILNSTSKLIVKHSDSSDYYIRFSNTRKGA